MRGNVPTECQLFTIFAALFLLAGYRRWDERQKSERPFSRGEGVGLSAKGNVMCNIFSTTEEYYGKNERRYCG